MTLTDQQLRQELMSFGESVPPITQRNREQLRARLEVLQSRTRTRTPASPSRSQTTASPSRSQVTASPSRTTRATASPALTPSASATTSSPSRTNRVTASPVRAIITGSPARARSSMPPTIALVRPATRSQQTSNLIELSDSETDAAATSVTVSRTRSTRSGQSGTTVTTTMQTRSTATRRQNGSPASPTNELPPPGAVFGDVEQSIARHRREIKQLLDSARDRNRTNNATISPKPVEEQKSSEPGILAALRSRSARKVSKSDTDDEKHQEVKHSPKLTTEEQKQVPTGKCSARPCQLFGGKCRRIIKSLLMLLFVGSIIAGGAFLLYENREFFAPPKAINCSAKDATTCEGMKTLVAAVRNQLQVRTGEVECGYRQKNDGLVSQAEVEKYLNDNALTFIAGDAERWNALVNYVVKGEANDILLWDAAGKPPKTLADVQKLSTKESKRSLVCQVNQDIPDTTKHSILIGLGVAACLTFVWYIRKLYKLSKQTNAQVKEIVNKVSDLLKDQYEKHAQDSQVQPWISVKQIHDKIFSQDEQPKEYFIWQRVQKEINRDTAHITSESQEVDGEKVDVWRWSQPSSASPKKVKPEEVKIATEETEPLTTEVGLTECLKLRNCFRSDKFIDDGETNQVMDIIRKRCTGIKQIDHIGVNSIFVYVKFSSKEAAAQGYHLLNEWHCQSRPLNVKYIRLSRYFDHFPEARDTSPK